MKYLLFILSFFIFAPCSVFAEGGASLSLLLPVGAYQVGDVFTVSVSVNTSGQPINAVEGQINFNAGELEVTGISEDGSIIGSWTREPSVLEEGSISFGGGIARGFTGDSGKIFSIDFRARGAAQGAIRFTTGAAILADDGMGTNIIESMNGGVYDIAAKEVVPVIVQSETPAPMVLGASSSTAESSREVSIISPSHLDQNAWHRKIDARFLWTLPQEAIAVRLSFDREASTTPTKLYSPAITEKTIKDVRDGISYFHLQVRTKDGWGESVHYRFQTDNKKPDAFSLSRASTTDALGFVFFAHDEVSGVEKYLISIDNGPEMEWKDDGTHTYVPPELESGEHLLFAKAVDFAGNFATSSAVFQLESVAAPVITGFPATLAPGSALSISGMADQGSIVSLWISKNGAHPKEERVESTGDGKFMFVTEDTLEEGVYRIRAEEIKGGARSPSSGDIFVTVRPPHILFFGKIAIDYLSILIPLATLVLLLLFILAFGWHRFRIFRLTLQKELEKAETVSHESFSALRKEIDQHEADLKDKNVSKRKAAASRIKKSIDNTEASIEKDLSEIKQKTKRSAKIKVKRIP